MAVKASNEVTVIDQTDAKDLVTWYQLSTSAIKPNKPTTTSASATPSGWTKAEPSYDPSQGTKYLYTCQQLVWGDDTCSWGDVQLSSSYEAAKAAVNAAASVRTYATTEFERTNEAVALRATKTEAAQMAQPNLSPFFSMAPTNVYNAATNPDGYWASGLVVEQLADGWAHIDFNNTGTGNTRLTIYEHCAWRHRAGDLKGSTKYTVMFEFRNVTKTGSVTCVGMSQHATSWPSMFIGTSEQGNVAVADGTQYHVGTTVADPASVTGSKCTTRTLITFPAGSSLDAELRISLYEGEYAGPYKPYSGDMMYATNAELKVTADGISTEVSKKVGNDEIISKINQSAETVKIQASKVEIEGAAIFTSGRLTDANIAKTANSIPDTRNNNQPPSWYFTNYPKRSITEFKQCSVLGLSGEIYCYLTTVTGWTDSSGGYPKQTAQVGSKFYYRTGISNNAWGDWGDTESTANEAYDKITSRGEQLIVNGNGFMGDNTNFSQLTFDGSQANGSPGSFTKAVSYTTPFCDSLFPVDSSKEYICEFDVKAGSTNSAAMYAMLLFYDVDKLNINVQMVSYFDGSTTTLAQELKNGDTKVYLTNASGFANTSAAHERSLIIWDYTNSFGYTYPAETYSRNYYAGVYSSDSDVDKTNNVISLASAWTGGTHAAGTPISQNRSGSTYSYFWYITNKALFPTEWTHVTGTYSGTRNTGAPNQTGKFWPGTAYCKIGWLWNYGANTTTNIQDPIWVTNISVKENVATVQALDSAVDAARSAVEASASYRDQTIYRSAASGTTSMSKNTTWVTDVTGGQNKWTTRRPEYSQSYPVLFVAVQRQTITQSSDTSCTCTTPAIDDTTTVIDGGNIITGSVTANKLNASNINASKTLTVGALTDAAAATILNSNVVVGGRNLLLWTKNLPKGTDTSANGKDGIVTWGGALSLLTETVDGIKLTAAGNSQECIGIPLANNGSVNNNEDVMLSFEARGNITSVGQFYWIQASGSNPASTNWLNGSSSITLSETNWTKFTTNVKHAQANVRTCTKILMFYNLGSANSGKWIEIRKGTLKLERGNKATDWSPAPEDVDADISKAAQTATNYVTEINGDGVWVTPSNAKPVNGAAVSTTSGWHISSAIELFRAGVSAFKVWVENNITKVRVGRDNDTNIVLDPNGIGFFGGSSKFAKLAAEADSTSNMVSLSAENLRGDGYYADVRAYQLQDGDAHTAIAAGYNNNGTIYPAFVEANGGPNGSNIRIGGNVINVMPDGITTIHSADAENLAAMIACRAYLAGGDITIPANGGASATWPWQGSYVAGAGGNTAVNFPDTNYIVVIGKSGNGQINGFDKVDFMVTGKTTSTVTIAGWNSYSQAVTIHVVCIGFSSRYGSRA